MMKELCDEMIQPDFGEYKYYFEINAKPKFL